MFKAGDKVKIVVPRHLKTYYSIFCITQEEIQQAKALGNVTIDEVCKPYHFYSIDKNRNVVNIKAKGVFSLKETIGMWPDFLLQRTSPDWEV